MIQSTVATSAMPFCPDKRLCLDEPLSVSTIATPANLSLPFIADDDESPLQSSIRREKVLCIGAGYVGGPTMAVIAEKCPDIDVYVVDISKDRIDRWKSEELPIYEPGLYEIVKRCRERNLHFSTKVAECIRDCDIIFIAVDTPTKQFGMGKGMAADMANWELACRSIAANAESSKIIIEKSTVPIHTANSVYRILEANVKRPQIKFAVMSNPEFLAEGTAIRDLLAPDRVLIGGRGETMIDQFAVSVVGDIYKRGVPTERILTTNLWSSELAKLVANAFLAQRVSSINAIAMLCEKTGADVRQIAAAVGADSRIGSKFLNASVGFGGSCFQKDVQSLSYICDFFGLNEASQYWKMVVDMNDLQKRLFAQRIIHKLFHTVNRKKIAVFGFAFKKDTGDTRSTPALDVCAILMNNGAFVHVYDPKVAERSAAQEFKKNTSICDGFTLGERFFCESTPQDAVKDAHAIVILTEWDEFKNYDYQKFYELMFKPAFVFDGRNLLDHEKLAAIGFEVHGIGIPSFAGCDYNNHKEGYSDEEPFINFQ